VVDLGLIDYEACWALQNGIAAEVAAGTSDEILLLLEHPHTYTCGRRGGRDHILLTDGQLARAGVKVLDVDRGGDVTYHGPGQLVAYPIISLSHGSSTIDYHRYLRRLEQALISTLATFAIKAHHREGYSGVWVGAHDEEKIAAIGVRVDGRGVTTHGIALNVDPDLRYFSGIVPCGISDKGVTSMGRLLASVPHMKDVKGAFASSFVSEFGYKLRV
jgi:lipoate-protein ligase B